MHSSELLMASSSRLRTIGLSVATRMFLLSLGGRTIGLENDKGFLLGFVCLLFGMEYLAWYAKPCILLSAVFLATNRFAWASGTAAVAVALSLTAFQIREILVNEAGTTRPVAEYGPGFWLWLACGIVLLVTSLACWAKLRASQQVTAG